MMWQDSAACRGADPRIFFPERVNDALEARRICEQCPVASECHEFAQTSDRGKKEQWGVWAGVNYSPRVRSITEPDPEWARPRTLICDECGTAWRWHPARKAKPPRACSAACRRRLQGRATTLAAKLRKVG